MINIIIPCYNCGDTIGRTLSSIASQLEKNKTIVTLVDDCSTENYSKEIEPFKNLLYIKELSTNENSGAGVARQVGIDNCNCEYLMFLDSDDVLSPFAISLINWDIQREKPDILSTSFYEEGFGEFILKPATNKSWLHGKVFKTKFLQDNNLKFHPTLRYNEDGAFNHLVFSCTKNILYKDMPFYIWASNKKSTVRGQHQDYYIERLYTVPQGRTWVAEILLKRNKITQRRDLIISSLITFYLLAIDIDRVGIGEKYQKERDRFYQEVKTFIESIDYFSLVEYEDFKHDLSIEYWNMGKPYYGPAIPSFTFDEFYSKFKD